MYYAGVAEKNGALVTAGGRVMSLTACGDSLREAVDKAYAATELVRFDRMMVRPDIGARALEA